MVLNIGFINQVKNISKLHFISIKIVAMLVILYHLTYQNNNNYFLFLVTLYLYFTSAKIDIIMFFNHFSFFIFYLILQIKL